MITSLISSIHKIFDTKSPFRGTLDNEHAIRISRKGNEQNS